MCKQSSITYIPQLDGLRGIAILAVLFHHGGSSFFQGGFVGVDLFFLLSGYLITSILLHEFNMTGTINLKFFYIRRFFRLFPLLAIIILIYDIICLLILDGQSLTDSLLESGAAITYSTNWVRAFSLHTPRFFLHTWSLAIEEQFYLLWPVAFLVLSKKCNDKRFLVLVTILLSFMSITVRVILSLRDFNWLRLYNGLDTRIESIMLGCTISIVYSYNLLTPPFKKIIKRICKYLSPLTPLLFIQFFMTYEIQSTSLYIWGLSLVNIVGSILLVDILINPTGFMSNVFRQPLLIWMGRISYGLYLIHYPVFLLLWTQDFSVKGVTFFGICISIALALISYFYIEKPFLSLKHRYR